MSDSEVPFFFSCWTNWRIWLSVMLWARAVVAIPKVMRHNKRNFFMTIVQLLIQKHIKSFPDVNA